MIIVLKQHAPADKVQAFCNELNSMGFQINDSVGSDTHILGLIGDTKALAESWVLANPVVETCRRVSEPYKKANRKFHPDDTVVDVGGHKIGGGYFAVMSGPCSVESKEQITYVAQRVQAAGASILRGGAQRLCNLHAVNAQNQAAILLAVVLHWFLTRTRAGLNLRAVGENPATADAAGINVTLYKYLSTCIGAGICGIGGLYYVLDYNQGIWATTGQIEALGWLAVALVIFTTWKPLNAIWGAYLFGMLYWLYQFLPSLLGITMASHITDLVQMLPYVVTIIVLIVVSMRKKKENQPPAHLGLAYFREER